MTDPPLPAIQAQDAPLAPGMCEGFAPGSGDAHRLVNESSHEVVDREEVGDRTPADRVTCPDHDPVASEGGGRWRSFHRDGSPYSERERG